MNLKIVNLQAHLTDDLNATVENTRFKFDPLYSGGACFIDGFDAPAYVDLAALKIDPAPKALLEHDPDAVVGHLENIVNDGKSVVCEAVIGGCKLAAKVVEWSRNVANWACSIGVYRITDKDVEFVKNGAKSAINGREVVGPAYIIHGGYLAEGSFVAIGGDGEAKTALARFLNKENTMFKSFRAAEGADEKEKGACAEVVEERDDKEVKIESETEEAQDVAEIVSDAVETAIDDAGLDVDESIVSDVVEEVVDELTDATIDDAETIATAILKKIKGRNVEQAKAGNALAENRRIAGINALVASYGKDAAKAGALAISRGWSVEKTEKVIKADFAKRERLSKMQNITYGNAELKAGPKPQDVCAAAFAQTLGLSPKRAAAAFGQDAVDASMSKPWRGITFRGVVAASLNSYKQGAYDAFTGRQSGWNDCKAECLKARLTGGAFKASADFSTISATDVFQLVLQAFLEPSEELAPRVYSQITRENKVVDFNEFKSYLPTIKGRLQKISETGAIQNVSFTTQEFTRSASPFASIFSIPEITIINDQIDTFAELLRQLERLGDDCIEHDVAETFWRLIDGDIKDSDSNSLVSTTVGNYITSGSLDESGLAAATTAMAAFSNANGIPLAVDKLYLVAGSKLSPAAWKLAHSTLVNLNGGTAYPNYWQGRFTPIEWAYFDSAHARAKKDDGSTNSVFAADKTWCLLRDPQRRPAVCVNKVVGFESPRIEQFTADPSIWGTTYRYIYPYGVSVQYKDAIVATTNS